ncbi:ErfK/YbiS/YcfS/YnhG family protein [Pseudoxanthomonas dokdonensis]|uniref:ErfK/YbiS/YcfS/YnhG family protein n=2 Tax=Pseudoxanthomonas dokdonensis TaxID=344882 RepID=A0A0R0D457_9GAMM|nr:ErfK/YbiS/YcfS/YnhG family protein [Pseudoxanthomonas dokdonensis]
MLLAGILGSMGLAGCSHAPSASSDTSAAAALPWADAGQLVLVLTAGWDDNQGRLQTFERSADGWRATADSTAITIGRNGAAWGIGLHPQQADGPRKQEGDGRAPAGVFELGPAFGYASTVATALDYQPMADSHYCVDVVGSPLYNQIVDSRVTGAAAVKDSTEPMRRDLHADGDQRYREGFVIRHNPDNLDGQGSCIFAHLWKAPGEPTAGCTAMPAAVMDRLLGWLQPQRRPVFVLLPQAEYQRLQAAWNLPTMTVQP